MASLILSLSTSPWSGHAHCWNQQGETSRDVKQTSKIGFYTRGDEWINDTFSPFFARLLRLDISYPRTCHVMSCLVDSCLGMLKASFSLPFFFYVGVFRGFRGFHLSYAFVSITVMGMLLLQLLRRGVEAVVLELAFPPLNSL